MTPWELKMAIISEVEELPMTSSGATHREASLDVHPTRQHENIQTVNIEQNWVCISHHNHRHPFVGAC